MRRARRGALVACLVLLGACGEAEPTAPRITGVQIRGPERIELPMAGRQQLQLVVLDSRNVPTPVRGSWRSSDPGIVVVDDWGVITAVGYGVATITGSDQGFEASIRVATRPAAMRVRTFDGSTTLVAGEAYDVLAEFLDANGAPVVVPWVVTWIQPDDTELEMLDRAGGRRIRLTPLRAGVIELVAHALDMKASLSLGVLRADDELLEVVSFSLATHFSPVHGWSFAPDLVVTSRVNAVVRRVEFPGGVMACGGAPLRPDMETPLFDFQPYNFSWFGARIAPGTRVEAVVTYRLGNGTTRVRRTVGDVVPDTGIVDRGTEGFAWSRCP